VNAVLAHAHSASPLNFIGKQRDRDIIVFRTEREHEVIVFERKGETLRQTKKNPERATRTDITRGRMLL